jgi:hypothetical protein
MMLGYFIRKRRDEWASFVKNRDKVPIHQIKSNFKSSLFGSQFLDFINTSIEILNKDQDFYAEDAQLFYDNNTVPKLTNEYHAPDSKEEFYLDFEVYDLEEPIIIQHHFESDVNNDSTNLSIRWKLKHLKTLK